MIERLLGTGLLDPGPAPDDTGLLDFDPVEVLISGLRVVLERRNEHAPGVGPDAEDVLVSETRQEGTDDGTEAPLVGKLQFVRRYLLRHGSSRSQTGRKGKMRPISQ